MVNKNRPLRIFKYLWEHTDESHPATTADIIEHLASLGITTTRKTIAEDVTELQESGFDIVCNRSRQNEYFIGSRYMEVAELKMLVDAVQAARFIYPKKSAELIGKVSALASPHQSIDLKRNLFVDGKVKTSNEAVYYSVDALHHAIQNSLAVTFQYIEYTADKKKVLKHNGQKYVLSPYDLVWCNDGYYVVGWSESHDKVVKFRVDRMVRMNISEKPFRVKPKEYDIAVFCRQVFSMYDGELCKVELKCKNALMKTVIDRFGEDVETMSLENGYFKAVVEVSVSPTFYSWVFTFDGGIKILSPKKVRQAYIDRLKSAENHA